MKFKLGLLALIISFAGGFLLAKKQYSTATAITADSKETNQTHTVITEVKDKNGQVKTVTTIDSKTKVNAKRWNIIPVKEHEMNYSIMWGRDMNSQNPYYGVAINKNVFNGITMGGWLLNHSGEFIGGVSVGYSF